MKSGMMRTPSASDVVPAGGVTGTLTTMLNKTTAILPEGLIASLGVSRGDESIRGAKHQLSVERHCQHHSQTPPFHRAANWVPTTSSAIDIATLSTPPHVAALYAVFRVAIERDLRANLGRIKMYLGDADSELQEAILPLSPTGEQQGVGSQYSRTAKILIDHIQERTLESFQSFVDQVREVFLGGAQDGEEGRDLVREIRSSQEPVRDVIKEGCAWDVASNPIGPSGNRG
ncbi:hypothetical protein FA15DRAFT_706563 [Coprinopsis marcescibilis]|uniref:Uncharacterized protein n=1 Tax=Coprinopsis marcescibilis TaxID=230819 RepID=A0A5C3KPJ7_COPMA|nr:hypothetical protein FA15DRAFT_706563 [Coprinopsis marcescibilis]